MSGIAGIAAPDKQPVVERMLEAIKHRGRNEQITFSRGNVTFGVSCSRSRAVSLVEDGMGIRDYVSAGHFAVASIRDGILVLERDPLGVAPLYYGLAGDNTLCFASEVKALLSLTTDIREMPPGCRFDGTTTERVFDLLAQKPLADSAEEVAVELRKRLEASVKESMSNGPSGAWLSGGLDSSSLAALARPLTKTFHTFSAGLAGAPDLEYARELSRFIGSEHHEVIVDHDTLFKVLPDVIYHLESFDALLVRSSIMNYLVGKVSADYVPAVISGEGGDELFAGYAYLKPLSREALADELLDITRRLHNTALQRVDRCASAHGFTAHVCFLHPRVLDYALRIPVYFKIRDGIEKWILRRAMEGALPQRVLDRPKAKFWEGAGVGDLLSDRAEETISDASFVRERVLPNGCTLRSKEELLYYRLFREHFGTLTNLSWMGRTKPTPVGL